MGNGTPLQAGRLPCKDGLLDALPFLVENLGATVPALDTHGSSFYLDVPATLAAFVVNIKVLYHPMSSLWFLEVS